MRNSGISAASAGESPRILVVGVDWLGDALFMTPVFRAVKKKWPQSFLAVSTASRNLGVLSRCPDLDTVIPYDEVPFLLGLPAQQRLASRFQSLRFGSALFLHRSFTRALAAARAGIPKRLGFRNTKRDWLMTELIDPPAPSLHRIDAYLSVLAPLGITGADRTPAIRPLAGDLPEWNEVRLSRTRWAADDRILVLHPGGNWNLKRWPVEHFAETARRASAAGWKVAVCGSAHEAHLGRTIEAAVSGGSVVSFCGATSFGALVGLLASARLLISNDSGPLHLAAALGTPVTGLFGPTLARLTGPVASGSVRIVQKDFGCELPCLFADCRDRVCLDRLTVDEALAAASAALGEPVVR